MKKPYERPKLEEYGKIRDLTYGSTGRQTDWNFLSGGHVPNPQDPSCASTRGEDDDCVRFSR
jgi:hypothetical protein